MRMEMATFVPSLGSTILPWSSLPRVPLPHLEGVPWPQLGPGKQEAARKVSAGPWEWKSPASPSCRSLCRLPGRQTAFLQQQLGGAWRAAEDACGASTLTICLPPCWHLPALGHLRKSCCESVTGREGVGNRVWPSFMLCCAPAERWAGDLSFFLCLHFLVC